MSVVLAGVCKSFGVQQVLKDVSFSVMPGEITGFLGPNGAGKTTTMRIIAGILPYDSGLVTINGIEAAKNRKELNRVIGYLPEHNPLYNEMFVREYLRFVAQMYCLPDISRRIEEVIEKTGLGSEAHKLIGQLSKGYRQRVGLAQALIHNPHVLILDEPTTGLDPNQLIEIRTLIQDIGKEKSVILSTHIMQEVEAICNKVVIISKGSIVADYNDIALIRKIIQNLFHFQVEFVHDIIIGELEKIKHVLSVQTYEGNGFLLTASQDVSAELFDFAVESNNKIRMMKPLVNDLEDVFRNLTK